MPEYTVESPLLHNGKAYTVGDGVKMKEEQAQPLLDAGVLSQAEASASEGDMTVAELTAALEGLEVDIPKGSKKADLVELFANAAGASEGE